MDRSNSAFSKAVDAAQRVARKAFDRASRQVGVTTDPDLALYEKLTPEDFQVLVKKYGPDEIVGYIKAMEARQLKEG